MAPRSEPPRILGTLQMTRNKRKAEGLTLKLLPSGKLLLIPQGRGFHYTLHPGHKSGIIDIHRTSEQIESPDTARHETLAAIPKEELVRSLREIGIAPLAELLKLFRPIRIGWIARNRLCVVAFPTDEQLDGVREIKIDPNSAASVELLECWFQIPEFIDDIFDMPNAAFLLFNTRSRAESPCGILFKLRQPEGRFLLRWIRSRDLRRWSRRMESIYLPALKRFCITEDFGFTPESPSHHLE